MDIENLLLTLLVEGENLMTSWCVGGLLEVCVQAGPCTSTFLSNGVLLIDILGFLSGLVLLVELLKGGCETRGEAVLIVESESSLDCFVTDGVAVGEILG